METREVFSFPIYSSTYLLTQWIQSHSVPNHFLLRFFSLWINKHTQSISKTHFKYKAVTKTQIPKTLRELIPRSSTTSREQWTMWWSFRASSASVKLCMYSGLFCSISIFVFSIQFVIIIFWCIEINKKRLEC